MNYGDGLFETLRVIKGKVPFLEYHFSRLTKGMSILQFDIPKSFTIDFFLKEILRLVGQKKRARVRFTLFRKEGGLYTPEQNDFHFLIIASNLQQKKYKLPNKGLHLATTNHISLNFNQLSSSKTINSLPYILAAKQKETLKTDDVILLNSAGRVAEASSSNIVIWNGRSLVTPSLKEACIEGVVRSVLLELADDFGLKIKEKKIRTKDLESAKAVFLTNSIQGVKWVRKFEDKTYKKEIAKEVGQLLIDLLNQTPKL